MASLPSAVHMGGIGLYTEAGSRASAARCTSKTIVTKPIGTIAHVSESGTAGRLKVAHLLAVGTLDSIHYNVLLRYLGQRHSCLISPEVLTVAWLSAIFRHVAVFVTVSALHFGHVHGFRAVTRAMALLVTIAADHCAWLGAVASHMAFLAAIATSVVTASTLRAVPRKVASCRSTCLIVVSSSGIVKEL